MDEKNRDYLNFQIIDPQSGLTSKEDYKSFKVLEGSSDSRYEPIQYVGDLIEGKSKYDTNLTEEDLFNVERERALKQPTGAKAFNSVVGGLASGVLTAIQDVGYLLDFENNFKTIAGLEEVSENWLGQIMREGKEKISEGLPIYRQSNEVFDWDDPGFYFSALKGIIDSAVGFGLPGIGATKAVGSLQKALKLTQLFKMSEPAARVANSIGAGALTNFMEGKTMAVEQFENSVEAMKQNLTKTIFEDLKQRNPDLPANQLYSMAVEQVNQELSTGKLKEFEGIAGKEANKFMLRNTAFMLTDAIGLHGLYKGEGFTRGLLKEKGLQTWAKSFGKLNEENMLLQGAKEYGEEVSQNVLQKEAEYQSAKKSGADVSGTPENLSQRVFDFAFSDQAQLEGLMGFFGGGPQRIMMEVMSGNFGAEAKKRYQKTYDAQQDIVKENTDFINAKLGDYVKWQNLRNDAIKDGRSDLDEYLKNTSLLNLAGKNFRNQTTENLIRQLEDVAKGVSEDERLTHGWDENYQQQARDQVEEVKRLEKEFLRHTKYENQLETFTNRETKRILEKEVQLLKNEISTIDTDLELQEVKDTDLLNRKKTFEKDLSDATERIKQTEETFKEITKAEYQRKLVKERKEKEKGIREALNQITDQIKKEAATQKANNANNNINIKDEISKENIPSEAFNKPDEEIETNKVPDEVLTDKDIDRDNDTVDDDLTSLVNKNIPAASKPVETLTSEPVSEDEKQLAEELLENLKDYIPADVVESIPEGELSNAAVEGTDLSPEQKTLGILQNFIEAIKKSKKSEDISFDDLIARMLQILPKERVAPSFMALQDIFNFTQSSKQTGIVKRTNYRNLEEWSKLTPDERIALNSSITISKLLTIDQYTASSEEEINKSLDQLESETDKLNNENAAVDEYDYLRVEFAGNIIAYLSRNFNQIRNKRTEITNDLNASMQDKKILDPDLYKEGTEIILRLEDNPNTPDYVHGTENKQKTIWGANKDHWNSQLKSGLITQEKYDELIRDNVPIGIYAGEQKIGYLHNVEWIKPSNVVEDGIEESIAVNRKVRNHVIANKEFTTKITKRTPGYLFRSVSGPVSTTQALPDKNLTVAVVKNGTLYTKRKTEYLKSTLNKSLKEGCTYVIVPAGEEEFALPLLHNKIGDQENVVKTIRKAIEIFYNDTYDKNVQDKAFVDAIADKMRINIRQAVGLSEFIRQFVNLYDVGEHRNTDHPMQSFIKSNTTIKQQGDVFLTTFAREATNDLQLEIGRGGMESGVRTLSKAARAKISSQRFNTYVDEVIGMLRDAYFQTNLDNINTDKELVILNDNNELETVGYTDHLKRSTRSAFLAHNIADEGQPPRYVYTIQPVISFDDSDADESLKVNKVQIIPAEETVPEQPDLLKLYTPREVLDMALSEGMMTEKDHADYVRRGDGTDFLESFDVYFDAVLETKGKKPSEKLRSAAMYSRRHYLLKDDSARQALLEETEVKQKPKPVYKKTAFKYNQSEESDYAEASDYLGEAQLEKMEEETEVSVDKEGNVTGVRIKDFNAGRQQQIVDYIQKKITESVFENENRVSQKEIFSTLKKTFEDSLQTDKNNLEIAKEANETQDIQMFQNQIEYFEQIIANWDTLTALAHDQLNRIKEIVTKQNPNDSNDADEGDEEGIIKGNEGWADADYLKNPEEKLSGQVKELFSGITEYLNDIPVTEEEIQEDGTLIVKTINPYGTPKLTYFGAEKTLSFQEVYSTLQGLTANLRGDYESIIKTLEKHRKVYPWLGEVIEKLEKSTRQDKFAFTTAMTNHYVGMQYIMFTVDPKSGAFGFTRMDSDANEKTKKILQSWEMNLLMNSAHPLEKPDEYIIPKELRDAITYEFETWDNNKKHPPEAVRAWLDGRFGITFNDLAWKSIVEGEFYTDGKRINYLTFIAKIRKLLYENVKKRGASPLSNDTRIIEGTFFKDLAKLEARYSKIAFTNSHRSGKKTVYSYANNKFLVTRLRELKENSNDILGDLKKLSFNGKSAWLEAMHGNTEEENKKFLDNFTYQILSLEPLKKKGAKSRDNNEMYRLSRAEIETVKLGFLQSLAEDQSGNNQRVINLLYPSTSDKTTVMLIQTVAQELKLSVDGKISNESLQKLYNYVVVPEINRMLSYQKRSESQRADLDTYKKGAANLFLFFPELNKVRELFTQDGNIYPDILTDEKKIELVKNKVKEYFDSLVDEKLKSWNRLGLGRTKDEEGKLVTTGLSNVFLSGKKNPEHNPLFIVNEESKVRGAAADMVFQYLIGNAEIAKLFVGDPALYYKQAKVNSKNKRKFTDPDYNFTADTKETYININKRLAADIAPGVDLANSEKDEYIQAFAADFPAQSLMRYQLAELLDGKEAVKELKELDEKFKKGNLKKDAFKSAISKYISAPYFLFDSTDAQEVTTWEEHLKILWKSGKLTDQEHTEIYQQLKDGKKIDEIKLGIIFQPIKPVYVDNKIDVGADIDRRLYIKSSSFPLLPQLTRGTQLDNLRIAMEKQGVHRLAYSTAVKVGNISEPIKIFDDNGNILPADQIDFTGKTLKLNRKGFRIQQDVPIGKVTEINKVSQASKNLLINMLDVDGFKVAWYKNGESIKGSELQEIYHERYNKLHKLYKERLLKELTNTETGNIDRKQLRDILLQEVRERSYPISNRELLELDKNLDLLAFSPASDKFESLLNSIVNNRIIKVKMPGKSYVLGSEEGFKGVKVENKEEISKRKEIIFTSSYDPETGLKPARIEDGVRKPSQAILPWKIKDQKGHIVDLKQFINEKNELDTSKIDPEILNLFGMRIPNQGPNSQGLIEIVGFLPKEPGDLIIATRDFVVQMGSDFDVDKLYTYMYYTYVDGEGDIKIQRNKGKYEEETLKNEIIDIHLAIHRNPDPVVQKQIATPLGTWKLERIANDIYEKRNLREQTAEGTLFTGLSDEYQTRMFKEATMGKSGVSVFSLDSMFNALAQGKNLVLTKKTAGNRKPVSIRLGNKTSEGNLSDIFALDGQTYKSDMIAEYQSAAVDNVKLQILAKLNINNNTFKVIKLLNQLGFGEEVPWFIAQDIVVDYCEELERLGSSLTGYTADKETQAYENVLNNEKYKTNSYNVKEHGKFATTEATVENLASYIEKGENAPNYRLAQRAILDKFIEFGELGQKIQTIQTTINPDSAGLGKSVFESLIKEDKVFELLDSDIINASTLVGEIKAIKNGESEEDLTKDGYIIRNYKGNRYAVKPKTINGFAIAYGLFTNNELWGDFFPYREPAVEAMFEEIELLSGSKDTFIKNKAERRKEMWNEFKSFLFTKESLGLYEGRIMDERRRLLFDVFEQQTVKEENKTITRRVQTHESLASIIAKLKNTPFGKQKLITLLEPDIKINGDRSLVKFNAASAEGSDEGIIYASLIDMLLKKGEDGKSPKIGTFNGKEYTARDIAQDLISYCYITGGIQEAIQFVKYVPAAYLHNIPFFTELSNFKHLESEFSIIKPDGVEGYYSINPFVLQYFQHNPEKVIQLKETDLVNPNSKEKDDITSFGITDKIKESIGLIIEDTVYEPALVTLRNSKSNSGLSLFRFDLKTGKYQKIDTLGSFGYAEYDYQAKEQTSLLKDNRTRKEPVKVAVVKEVKVPVVETESKNLIDQISSGKLTSSTKQNGIEIAKEILNDIILTGNDTNKVVAEMLYERIDYLPESLVFKIAPLKEAPPGTFFYRYSEKRKENGNTLLLNSDKLKSKDRDYIAHVILHELIHGVTGYKLRLYELEESIVKGDEGAQTNYDTLIKAVPKFALTENDREVIKSLTVLFNQIKNKLLSDDVFRTAYDKYLVENKKPVDTRNLTVEQISNFYGLTDLTEFVTMALTDKGFQNLLNSTTLDNGKTFLQALKERIIKLLESIGFDIKEGSALEASLFQMLDVLELQKPQVLNIIETKQEILQMPAKTETKVFKEHGTYYRFEIDNNSKVISGMYAQANLGNWMPFKDNKSMIKAYERVKNIKKFTSVIKSVQAETIIPDNQLTLQDGRIITFNTEQYDALSKMRKWLDDPNDQFFVLTGYAGTGKTTIVRKLIEENNKTKARKIGGATPTHRAKRVLSVLTGNDAKTLHSILGLGLNTNLENFTLTKPVFDPKNPPTIGDYDVIIIDESSMINKNLFEYTINLAKSTGTKLIFMGDPGQIPPVGEVASKVFSDDRIKNRANLVKVERLTDGNPLNKVFDAVRSNIKSAKDLFAHKTQLNDRKEGILFTPNKRNFVEKALAIFTSEEYAADPNTAKVISWTNERTGEYNQAIREKLIGANVDIVEVNDILMGYETIEKDKYEVLIENSADYKVVRKSNKIANRYGVMGFPVIVVDTNDLQKYNEKTGYEKSMLEKEFFIVDHTNSQNFDKYAKFAIRLLNEAKSFPIKSRQRAMGFASYYAFRRANLSFKDVSYTNTEGRSDKAMNKHIDYGYAITAHKSQGGTYKHVFVDEDNIDKNQTIQERNQIKYVALSRASHTATVLSFKTEESNNSFVQPAQSEKVAEPVKSKSKPIDLEDEGIDMAQLMREMKDLGSEDRVPGEDEELEFEGSLYPQEVVPDDELDKFMKQCKG